MIEKLNAKQVKAISLLAQGQSQSDVARALKTNKVTLRRWRNENEHYIAALNTALREVWDEALATAVSIAMDQVENLREISRDENQSGATRVSASKVILDLARSHFPESKDGDIAINPASAVHIFLPDNNRGDSVVSDKKPPKE